MGGAESNIRGSRGGGGGGIDGEGGKNEGRREKAAEAEAIRRARKVAQVGLRPGFVTGREGANKRQSSTPTGVVAGRGRGFGARPHNRPALNHNLRYLPGLEERTPWPRQPKGGEPGRLSSYAETCQRHLHDPEICQARGMANA